MQKYLKDWNENVLGEARKTWLRDERGSEECFHNFENVLKTFDF